MGKKKKKKRKKCKFSCRLGPRGGATWTSCFLGAHCRPQSLTPCPHPYTWVWTTLSLWPGVVRVLLFRIAYWSPVFWVTIKTLTDCLDNILTFQRGFFFFFLNWKSVHASISPKYVFTVDKGLGFYLGGANSCWAVWFQKLQLLPLPCPIPELAFHTCSPT